MTSIVTPSLRNALLLDAVMSAPVSAALLIAPAFFAGLFALPQPLLVGAGVSMIGWIALLLFAARKSVISEGLARTFVYGNIVWCVACLVLPASGVVGPNELGLFFLVAQAVAVSGFAFLQWRSSLAGGAKLQVAR